MSPTGHKYRTVTKGMAVKQSVKLTGRLALLALAAVAVAAMTAAPADAGKRSTAKLMHDGVSAVVDGSVGGTLVVGQVGEMIMPGSFNGKATIDMLQPAAADGKISTVDLSISDPALNSFKYPVWLSHTDLGNKDKAIFWVGHPVTRAAARGAGPVDRLVATSLNIQIKVPLFHFSTYSVKGWQGRLVVRLSPAEASFVRVAPVATRTNLSGG